MSNTVPHSRHHIKNGTSQEERMPKALPPGYISIDERSQKELLDFAKALASRIHYYNESNTQEGNWEDFFNDNVAEGSPQKALLLVFLKLFAYVQKDLNTLTGRHLDFYYNEALRLKKKAAIADQVHVFFELAKNTKSHLLKAGTLLKAGKDKSGATLHYTTEKDIVINKATIGSLKTLFVEKNTNDGTTTKIHVAPVADSSDGLGTNFKDGEDKQWATFGDSATGQAAGLGFAISAPILFLNEGYRGIYIEFTFSSHLPGSMRTKIVSNPAAIFKAQLTGAKGWLQATVARDPANERLSHNEVGFSVQLDLTQEAVTAYNSTVHGDNFQTPWPLLKVMLNDHSSYDDLYHLQLAKVKIIVAASGVSDLILQSDEGALDTSKPFLPFGSHPVTGHSFYIGHPELQKKLTHFWLDMEWLNVPTDVNTYYSGYKAKHITLKKEDFQAKVSLLYQKRWLLPVSSDLKLFSHTGLPFEIVNSNYTKHISHPEAITSYDQTVQTGFIKLELTAPTAPFNAFGHDDYSGLYTTKSIALANNVPDTELPNAPYTPTIKSLRLSYQSDHTLDFSNYNNDGLTKFFHIGPFGYDEYRPNDSLLPQYTDEGTLYIGIRGLVPPQQLSILFRPAEGSAAPDNNIQEGAVNWSYLSGGNWVALASKDVSDSTTGLQASGIVTLDVPGSASLQNSIMPGGFHWLKAAVTKGAKGAGKLIALHTQAVTASFTDRGNDPVQTGQLLAANSVSGFAVRQSGIRRVTQPYPSFNGKPAEQSNAFYTRISERLRHKHRAITPWDYERLVLEAFSDIHRVQCLSGVKSTTNDLSNISENAAGYVTLVVIPDISRQHVADPLKPKVKIKTLRAIDSYVQRYTSPFVTVTARNPVYEEVQLKFKVQFTKGVDQGYYLQLLEQELSTFISPWAYNKDRHDIVFAHPIYKSAVLDFVEKRAYVNFVTDFLMLHSFKDTALLNGINQATVITLNTYTYTIRHYHDSVTVPGVKVVLEFTVGFDNNPQGTNFISDLRTAINTFLGSQSLDSLQRIDVVAFLEAYQGVGSVSTLRLFYIENNVLKEHTEKAVTERPGAILTAAGTHRISLFDASHEYSGASDTGIGHIIVEGDLKVT